MKFSTKQLQVMKAAILELAPEASINHRSNTGRVTYSPLHGIKSVSFTKEAQPFATMELGEAGEDLGSHYNLMLHPIATALHETGHVVQLKSRMNLSYSMMEITTEYCTMKLMSKYFPESFTEEHEQASRYYMAQYYHGYSRIVKRSQRLWPNEVDNFKEIANEVVTAMMEKLEPIAQELSSI